MGDIVLFAAIALWVYLVAAPVITFLHELAHALVALWLTDARITIFLGREPPVVRRLIGRLELRLHPRSALGRFGIDGDAPAPRAAALIAGVGPVASLLLTAGLVALTSRSRTRSIRSPAGPRFAPR